LIAFSEALRQFCPNSLQIQARPFRFSKNQLLLLTAIAAGSMGGFASAAKNKKEHTLFINFTAQDGQMYSAAVMGAVVPLYFLRQRSILSAVCSTALTAFGATGVSIVFGAYASDLCVYFEVFEELVPFNIAQVLVFVTWLTAVRIDSQSLERQFGTEKI
jgi:hypothetical protein